MTSYDLERGHASKAALMASARAGSRLANETATPPLGHFCIPLGYPAEGARFGGSRRLSTREIAHLDHWGSAVPWR